MNPTPLTVLGDRYTLTELIAAGGMGEVWSATDTVLRRTVAVKLLSPALGGQSGFLERFRAEARHTAALHHPNITTIFDYGEDSGAAYLVMELVAGQPLSQIISERAPLSPQETASILVQAAMALEAAHHAGVVHRDVKPANILITPDGTVKLTDFGISRLVDTAPLTQTGQVLGTAQYISPEQALGQSATAASDLYALGVVGQEMLTGRRPFDAGSSVATAMAQINQAPPPLPDAVPVGIRDVISACLAKSPADRPASAAAMAHALGMPAAAFASGDQARANLSPALPATSLVEVPSSSTPPAKPTPTRVLSALNPPAPTRLINTPGVPTQVVATTGLLTEQVGPPDQRQARSRRRPAWLLAAAAVAGFGVLAAIVLSSADNGQAPNVRATRPSTTTSANTSGVPTSAPITSATIVATVTASVPGQPPAGKGHKRKGKQ